MSGGMLDNGDLESACYVHQLMGVERVGRKEGVKDSRKVGDMD